MGQVHKSGHLHFEILTFRGDVNFGQAPASTLHVTLGHNLATPPGRSLLAEVTSFMNAPLCKMKYQKFKTYSNEFL